MTLNPFKIIFAIDKILFKIEEYCLIVSLILLLVFAFVQVFLRNFFDTAIEWGDVFNRLLVLWVGFFAATTGAKLNRHLSLEVLTKFFPKRAKPILNIFLNLFVIVVAGLLTHYSYLFFEDQIAFEATDLLFKGVPKAYFSIIFPIGFGIICFRYFVKLLEEIYTFAGGDKAYPKEFEGTDLEISVKIKMK